MADIITTEACDIAILGAGAAGMMAAVTAGERLAGTGRRIVLLEKNVRPGIKVLVCGGGRCNFTNAGTVEFLIEQFGRNGRFLAPALRALDNEGLRDFFAGLGVPSHVEHDGKVYPNSNRAQSVVDALVRRMRELEVVIRAGNQHAATVVERVENESTSTPALLAPLQRSVSFRIHTAGGAALEARLLILAVGGMSYQRMGTVGDGYQFAKSLGHTIVTPRPAIVGLLTREAAEWAKPLQGLAMRDAEVRVEGARTSKGGHGEGRTSTGDMLFTHFGLSGPAILNPSEIVAEMLERVPAVQLHIDFARHTTHEEAHATLRAWQQTHGRKRVRTMFSQHVQEIRIDSTSPDTTAIGNAAPATSAGTPMTRQPLGLPVRLAEAFCRLASIREEQACAELTSAQMHQLVALIKQCPFTITATRGFKEAMVTAGGVKLSEVNPQTMESKKMPGLFVTGEVLDLTGPSGGYNLQMAFSTGQLAGNAAAMVLGGRAI